MSLSQRPAIRELVADDRAAWQPLWEAYLDFYESPQVAEGSDGTFARLVARAGGQAGFVAERDGVMVGIAHAVQHASTWHAGPACYLEDLFVAPTVRGGGVGRALIEAVTAWGVGAGAERVYWITQTGNDAARRLYDTLAHVEPFVLYERTLD
jgi:GNAT superfamily N-acetyltransferase